MDQNRIRKSEIKAIVSHINAIRGQGWRSKDRAQFHEYADQYDGPEVERLTHAEIDMIFDEIEAIEHREAENARNTPTQ